MFYMMLFGMAMQAFSVALLMQLGIMKPSPIQQVLAGAMFVAFGCIAYYLQHK